ncbi:MAG: class I SAM-dependent methyltransferase [Alphaproteobacteria bacterium]
MTDGLDADSTDLEARDRALFNRIAADYGRKDLMPASRKARRHRLRQTLRHLPSAQDLDVLEVGCGAGFAASYLEGHYRSYLGIDYATDLISFGRTHNQRPGAAFEAMNARDIPSDRVFDVIFMIGVLHHLENAAEMLRQLIGNLKPGGWIVVNEPQRTNPLIHGMRTIRRRVDSSYSEDQLEYSISELEDLFAKAGFSQVDTHPQGVFSTPFAEVVMPVQPVAQMISAAACGVDTWLERHAARVIKHLAWNVVVSGRKPD